MNKKESTFWNFSLLLNKVFSSKKSSISVLKCIKKYVWQFLTPLPLGVSRIIWMASKKNTLFSVLFFVCKKKIKERKTSAESLLDVKGFFLHSVMSELHFVPFQKSIHILEQWFSTFFRWRHTFWEWKIDDTFSIPKL